MEFTFKKEFPNPSDRLEEWSQILKDFPDHIPIICEKDPKSNAPNLNKKKFIVPPNLTVSQFGILIRKKLKISQSEALFLLVNGEKAISGSTQISEVYTKFKDSEDNILYIMYATEMMWG